MGKWGLALRKFPGLNSIKSSTNILLAERKIWNEQDYVHGPDTVRKNHIDSGD